MRTPHPSVRDEPAGAAGRRGRTPPAHAIALARLLRAHGDRQRREHLGGARPPAGAACRANGSRVDLAPRLYDSTGTSTTPVPKGRARVALCQAAVERFGL